MELEFYRSSDGCRLRAENHPDFVAYINLEDNGVRAEIHKRGSLRTVEDTKFFVTQPTRQAVHDAQDWANRRTAQLEAGETARKQRFEDAFGEYPYAQA